MHTTKLTAAALLLLVGAARADDIVTNGGSEYSGRIVAEDETSVTIDTPALGRMRIARSEIAKVKRDAASPQAEVSKDAAKPAPVPGKEPAPAAGDKPTDAAAAEAAAAAAAAAAKQKAEEEAAAALSAEERDARRRASKIVRKTEPMAPKAPGASGTPPKPGSDGQPAEEKATLGGTQLAQVPRGSWVIVFQPPTQFEATAAAVQIGRRVYARIDSVGAASAWLAVPAAGGDVRVPMRLADVQRHVGLKPGASRLRIMEGIDKGAWIRVRLEDGTLVQGTLHGVQNATITVIRLKEDGAGEKLELAEDKVIEVDGLVRSTTTRLAVAEAAAGEQIGLIMWPDAREVVGTLKERTERHMKIETLDGETVRLAVDGPIADVRRVPAKWREQMKAIATSNIVHAKSAEDFADSRVERDVVGIVAASTAYALTLETTDGTVVMPLETVTALGPVESEHEAAAAKPMKRSDRLCQLPFLPGDSADKAKEVESSTGVSTVTDGKTIRHVFVTAPFDGDVFGLRIGQRISDAQEHTDIRFDTVVVPKNQDASEPRPAEMISHSLATVRVTLLLDAVGSVSVIELGQR